MYSEFYANCVSCNMMSVPEELLGLYIRNFDAHVCKECVLYETLGKYLLRYAIKQYYTFGNNLFDTVSSNARGLYSKPPPQEYDCCVCLIESDSGVFCNTCLGFMCDSCIHLSNTSSRFNKTTYHKNCALCRSPRVHESSYYPESWDNKIRKQRDNFYDHKIQGYLAHIEK